MVKGLVNLATLLGVASGLATAACGGSASAPDAGPGPVTSASAPVGASDGSASEVAGASHLKLGFAFTANLLGELEPCG